VNRKADFLQNESSSQNESIRIDSHNESIRIDSNRELECFNYVGLVAVGAQNRLKTYLFRRYYETLSLWITFILVIISPPEQWSLQ